MPAWTSAERRGALLVVALLALGAGRDLWRATHPRAAPPPPAPAAAPGAGAAAVRAAPAPGPPRAVDLNRAGPAELDALPGIGPVLAGRIVSHRAAHGPFREPEDLLAVPGIGPRLFERLRPLVRTGPPADSLPTPRPAGGSPTPRAPCIRHARRARGRAHSPQETRPAGR